ncbi:Ger(x)C family spore germination protein [Clostridium folliculivorans]|uniref:Spore germination protein GerC n=1 Tax=Clostridium folliculivorans TaxID=2886038 RepID=A0A9W5Y562_9CLOT|nr:Ger(x)C family spore germination protein [Clostridium folliculivorans]GKU26735.1 spore germination protein GerC [Clostridium folliculivorans]GKU28833.1 spore germination protein GerC [Clostridium folliculivorans]
MKKLRGLCVILEICITATLFQGCWDMREINELGLVMAVGIDKKGEDEFSVTVQVAKPNEAGGGNKGPSGEPIWVGTADGKTIFDAIRNVAKMSSRRIMWAHNNIIVIGENVARDSITPVVDFFTHNSELRMKTWIAVVKGEARPYIEAKTGMESIPALSLARLFKYGELPAKSIKSDMLTVFRDYKSDSQQPIISQLNMVTNASKKDTQVELAGSGVLKDDKLVGFLTPDETRGINFVREKVKSSVVSVALTLLNNKRVTVELHDIKTKIKSTVVGDAPQVVIDINAIGEITEQDEVSNVSIDIFKKEVENLIQAKIKGDTEDAIKKLQTEFNSDVVAFGRFVHIQNKEQWDKTLKYKWNETFKKTAVKVDVKINIDSSSLYQIPIQNEKANGGEKVEGKDK